MKRLTEWLPGLTMVLKQSTPARTATHGSQRKPTDVIFLVPVTAQPTFLAWLAKQATARFVLRSRLVLLSLFLFSLAALPALAQWQVVDQNGNLLTPQGSVYTLSLSETGTTQNTFPLGGSVSLAPLSSRANACFLTLSADNSISNSGYAGFYVPLSGPAVPETGSLTGTADGHLEVSYKYIGPLPAPLFLDLLLTPTLNASVEIAYDGFINSYLHYSNLTSGLSATAQITAQVTLNGASPITLASAAASASTANQPDYAGIANTQSVQTQLLSFSHLMRVPVINGVARVALDGLMTDTASNSIVYGTYNPRGVAVTNGPTDAYSSTYIVGTIQQDNREVTVSADCDSPPTYTFHKVLTGGLDANGDGLCAKFPHAPAPDGSMQGDIGIPYGSQHLNNQSIEVVSATAKTVTYHGHIPGNWATWMSHYWWNSSLKKYSTDGSLYHLSGIGLPTEAEIPVLTNVYNGPIVDNDTGLIIPNDAGTTGTTDNITFKFQNGDNRSTGYPTGNDGDGATAAASYALTIHQPIEVFQSHRPDETNHYLIASPSISGDIPMSFQGLEFSTYKGSGSNGLSAICVINSPSVSWDLANDVTNALSSVPYPGWWGVLDVIFSGANIYINHATPKSMNFPADFNDVAWSDPSSDGDSYYKAKRGAKADYHMSPRVRVQYRWKYKLVDVYNASGFQSETLSHDSEYIGPLNAFGVFTYTGPPLTP
ncbi:MAG: hypothetical protein ACRYFS_03480 [Janthinobacterium lividum]